LNDWGLQDGVAYVQYVHIRVADFLIMCILKRQSHEIFHRHFFVKQLPLVSIAMPRNDFEFRFFSNNHGDLCFFQSYCGEPAISHDSHHVSLVQWTTCLLPVTRDSGSNPLGGLLWNRDSSVSVVLLHYKQFRICQYRPDSRLGQSHFSPFRGAGGGTPSVYWQAGGGDLHI
jgi:hypothetical protein